MTNPLAEAIAPCPFDGSTADFGTRPNEQTKWSIHCDRCTAYVVADTRDAVISKWNTRLREERLEIAAFTTDRERKIEAALIDAGASLAAAISLLEKGGKAAKKAAPSDTMFDMMLNDYRKSLDRTRRAISRETVK